jgi:hypothetical protein
VAELRQFNIVLWNLENYYCPPVQKTFSLPAWVYPENIEWARVVLDLNPIYPYPAFDPLLPGSGTGCATSTSVTINGRTVKGKGDVCNIITVDLPPEIISTLKRTNNVISLDIIANFLCAFGRPQGTISGYIEGEAYVKEGEVPIEYPTPIYYPTGTPPPEEEECKVFGISIGKMPKEQCSQMQVMFMLMFLGLGAVLVISLLRR